ncbi:mucin-binding protein [Streptococcus parasanguinis]|uniref:mucin-binding protein n=2 Tax=Streptococcus parasanguinis TaxID=1318 RepID=UPI0011DE3255|nr:MucBP domain-containing protein [Streptococcus parasanguinis]
MNFDRKQRFSIRKYSIGVASVLIGSVLAGTTIASADTEVKIDDASKAPVTSTQEAPKVSAVSAQEASTQEAPTYSANAALVSTEKAEAPKVEAKTETPAKEQASQAEVKENAKDSKNEAKTEETVSEVKAPETEVKSEESEVKEAEKKADSTDKKSEDKPVDLKKEQLDVDKKVPGLDLKNATENPDGGFNIAFSKEAQEQYRSSLEAYIARRRNYNRRSSFREAGAGTSENPDYEFKKVMTPILPGFYADKASIEALVVDPDHLEDFNFAVWYKKLGSVVLVDEQGNYITPTGEIATNQADAAHKQYENDPSDPTRAWFTKVPTAPTGWEVKPGQNVYGYDAARQTVNPNQKDDLDAIGRDTKIVIVKQAQKAIIKYVNENGNVELSRDEVVGKSGEAIDYSTNEKVSSYRRRGFELVSDGFYDAANKNFDFDASVDQEFTVVLRERIEPIDPDKPTPTPDQPVDPKDPDTPKWPDPVKDVVNKDDVTRTVKYVYEDGSKAKEDVSETLHFKRFAYVNLVTGHIDYRPWTTTDDTFDAVTSPVIKGYTADKLVVPAVSGVQAGAADTVEVVTYVKDAQKAIIKYVNEKGNVELSRDAVAGKSGEAIDYSTAAKISSYKRQGYELVSDGFTSASSKNFDFDASVDQEFTVVLRERIEPIDPDKPVDPNDPDTPKWPDPVKDVVNKDDVTRTVKYVYEDGSKAKEDVSETLHFKRFAYVNLVTGHIDYRPWTTTDDTFDAVTSPVIKGYTADKLVVPAVSGVQAGATDTVEVVTYVKDAQKAIIKYVNEKGNVELSRDAVAGKSGEAIDYSTAAKISSYKRQGYELVNDGFTNSVNKNFDFDASVDQEFVVTLRERIEPIDPDKPTPTPDKPVDPNDPDTPKWPDPVKDIVNKETVTRTIHYVYEDGSKAKDDVTETLYFKRFAYVNLVTGHVEYRQWTSNDRTFDSVLTPTIKGYTADKNMIPAVTGVEPTAPDIEETVTYVKDAQKAIIKYVNEKGNVELSRDEVLGKSGDAINYSTATKISSYKRQGYELVSDGFTSASNKNFDFDTAFDQEFTVVLRERIEPIDPDKPTPTPDKPVDPNDPDTPKWPDPVKDVVNKDDVTRTVKYVYEDGSKAKEDVSETLRFKRFAYVNLVTGHIDYRPWTTTDDTFDAVTSPVIPGYTADKLVVPAVSGVQAGAADTVEVVTYVKDAQKAIIKYVNEKGNVELSRDAVAGKSGEAIDYSTATKISSYKRQGYELVSDGFTSASSKNFDFDASVDQEFTVVLRERIEPIDPDKPTPTPDKPVDPNDPDTPKWPDPVKDVVNKDDVTRTVKYVYEDGSKAKEDVSETLHFKRFAYVNLVTGHIDYRPWTTTDDTFDAVTSPVIKGYTADKLVVPAVSGVQAGAADTVEVVTYVKDAQKAIIKYVNEKGNVELSRDAVAGKSGEAIDYSTAAKISSYKRQGYELVSDGFTSASSKNFDFDASVDQEFTVVLRERIEPIDPDKPTPTPDKPVDPKDPDTPKWPDPVKDIVNKDDVTRTVKYVYEDGSKAKEDVSETLHFKRFAYVNLVTGHIDYRPWTTTDDTFDAVTSPVIKGYTADKLVVPAVSGVQAGAADTIEVVTYVKDAQKAIIKYINEKGNVEVARDTVNGKSGEVIAYTTTDKINELHRKGYELVSDGFTSASSKNFDFDASVDQEFTVVVRERVVPVGPEDPNPTPDTPYDPTDPNTPNWPKNVDKILNRRATATRTVSYFTKEEGIIVPKPVRERVVFERIVLVNLVTGEMTPQAWKFVSATPISDNEPNTPRTRSRRSLADAPVSHTEVASLESVAPRTRSRRALADAPEVPSSGSYTFIKVPTPVTPGAYTKVKEVDAILYIPEDGYGSVEVDKNFAKKIQLFKLGNIQLVDQNGNVLAETIYKNNETDATKAAPTALPAIPAGYKIKEGQTVYGYDATAGTVDPNNPTDPDAIGRNTTILLELQAVPRQEAKVVNETIHYKDAITGETLAPDHTDQVTFRRVVMVNPATNEVLSATSWVADNGDTTFDAVTSPVIEGYEASPLVVDAITGLTAESKDFVTIVLYRKKAVPTPQPDPVKPDPVKPDPVKPEPVKPDPVKPEPVKPEPVKPEPTKPATPDAPKAPALPETGVTDASTVTLLGAALGLVGLAGLAKRKRDENE